MTDPADITDDPRELAERLRRVAPKAPSHLQGKLYEAADALARLAPEPRQWQPGEWFEYDSGHDDSLAMVFAIHPLGDVIAVGWDGDRGDWNPGWFAHDPDTDGQRCAPPPSWVEAGRPGAPQPAELEPQEIEELARWLVDVCQFPLDWHTAQPPPPWVRRVVEDRWVEVDLPKSDSETTADDIRATVAEEGGWSDD